MAQTDASGGLFGASTDYLTGADPAKSVRAAAQREAMLIIIERMRRGQDIPQFKADGTFFAYRGPVKPQETDRHKVDYNADYLSLAVPGLSRSLPEVFRGGVHESTSTKVDRVLLDPIDDILLSLRARIDRLGAAATGVIDDGALHRWILEHLLGFDASSWPDDILPRLLVELFAILPRRTTSAAIERLAGRMLDVPVTVRQNVSSFCHRFKAPDRMGKDKARLGVWTLGGRRADRERLFEVWVGPVSAKTAKEYLPSDVFPKAKHRAQLVSLVRFCQPANTDFRVGVRIDSSDAQMSLGKHSPTGVLGLTTQLGRRHADATVEEMFAATAA